MKIIVFFSLALVAYGSVSASPPIVSNWNIVDLQTEDGIRVVASMNNVGGLANICVSHKSGRAVYLVVPDTISSSLARLDQIRIINVAPSSEKVRLDIEVPMLTPIDPTSDTDTRLSTSIVKYSLRDGKFEEVSIWTKDDVLISKRSVSSRVTLTCSTTEIDRNGARVN